MTSKTEVFSDIGDEITHALSWARLHQNFSNHEVVTSRAWATTLRLINGNRCAYLKLIPDKNSKRSAFLELLSEHVGESIPALLASEAGNGWYLFEDHGGTDLSSKQGHKHKLGILDSYAKLQVKFSQNSTRTELENVQSSNTYWERLCEFLNIQNEELGPDGAAGGRFFLGRKECVHYLALLKENEVVMKAYLKESDRLPFVLEHTDLRPSNMARNEEGGLIFYDWDDAVIAPLGFSLHNQFSGCSRAFLALRTLSDQTSLPETSLNQRFQDRELLAVYMTPFEQLGIHHDEKTSSALSASITLGVIHSILDFAAFPPKSKSARSTIGKHIAKRLDDLLTVPSYLHPG